MGAGKTEVGKILAGLGAFIVDADALARAAIAPGTPGFAAVAARFPAVVAPDGSLDRAALARIVFADPAERAALNGIVHPEVRRLASEVESTAPPDAIVVHDVPLLFEGDYWRRCDRTIVVVAPRELRIDRVAKRSGFDVAEIARRMDAQIDPEIARARADDVIENDAGRDELAARTTAVWRDLRRAMMGDA